MKIIGRITPSFRRVFHETIFSLQSAHAIRVEDNTFETYTAIEADKGPIRLDYCSSNALITENTFIDIYDPTRYAGYGFESLSACIFLRFQVTNVEVVENDYTDSGIPGSGEYFEPDPPWNYNEPVFSEPICVLISQWFSEGNLVHEWLFPDGTPSEGEFQVFEEMKAAIQSSLMMIKLNTVTQYSTSHFFMYMFN